MNVLAQVGVGLDAAALLGLRHVSRRMAAPPLTVNALPGGMVNRRRGRGLEAADIRAFVPGDDVRLIDRNVTARTGSLHVRTVHDERDQTVLLMADFRPSMLWGTRRAFRSVAAAEALALIGWRVVAAGGRVALLAFGTGEPVIVPPRGRDRGMVAVIGGMARAHEAALARAGEEPPLSMSLSLARRMMPRGSAVWLASALDGGRDMDEEALRALDHRCPLTVLRVRDAFEVDAPDGTYPFRLAGGDGGTVRLPGGSLGDDVVARLHGWGIAALPFDAAAAPDAIATKLGDLHV